MRVLFALALGLWASAAPIVYVLDLWVERDGAFQGTATVTFPCPGKTDLVFRLYPNHFGPFLSLSEAQVNGAKASWESLDPTVAVVVLPNECFETTTVTLVFRGELPHDAHGYGLFVRQARTMTLAQFYPVLAPWREGWIVYPTFPFGDNLVAEAADYVLTVRVPEGWLPVGSGSEEELSSTLWRLTGTNLREMGLVLVKGYAEKRLSHPLGVELRVLFPPELRPAGERALEIAAEALALFSSFFGPYPYPDLDMVFVPLWGAAGVEYPRLILIGEDYAGDPGRDFFAEIVVHELAHQWWYGEVGTDQVAEPWLDEGLATYASVLYFEAKGKLAQKVREWEAHWARAQALFPQGSVGSALWEFAVGPQARRSYSGYVYSGAALFLHEARKILGDAAFFAILRRFCAENRGGLAQAARLLALFEEVGGPALGELYAKYFRR